MDSTNEIDKTVEIDKGTDDKIIDGEQRWLFQTWVLEPFWCTWYIHCGMKLQMKNINCSGPGSPTSVWSVRKLVKETVSRHRVMVNQDVISNKISKEGLF